MKDGSTPEEDILGLLDRLEKDYSEAKTIEELRSMLKGELGYDRPALADAIWDALPMKTSLEAYDIRGINVTYPWGVEHRYAIQGLPGLWGYARVREIMEEEER